MSPYFACLFLKGKGATTKNGVFSKNYKIRGGTLLPFLKFQKMVGTLSISKTVNHILRQLSAKLQ